MKNKIYIIISILTLTVGACKKSFLDINTNPNTLPTTTPNYVFTAALNNYTRISDFYFPNDLGSFWSGLWTQSNSYISEVKIFGYIFTENDFGFWSGYYNNLNDFQYVIDNADANNQKFLKGPAKVMKALIFQQLVDLYGNVPFTDALKGVKSLAPKFDDQKTIYESLILLLDEAIADIKANAFSSVNTEDDIVFNGNTVQWAKFANSIKLRILMRQSRVSSKETYIKTEINKILTEGSGFLTNEEATLGGASFYQQTAGKLNPIYAFWGYNATNNKAQNNDFPRLTQFLVNTLKASNDTFRLKRLAYAVGGEGATPGVSARAEIVSNYVGIPFGAPSGFAAQVTSPIGPSLIIKGKFDKPYIIMTAAEVQLNLAEAKERFGSGVSLSKTAKEYFEAGIKESFRILGANVEKANLFIDSGIENYDYTASKNKLNAIAYQKWVAHCNFNGLEAWAEYRKTDYPVTPQSLQVVDSKRPVRLFYPASEAGSNTENVKAQGTIDVFSGRLFWDVD